jgi:apolipoprotein N-acyltransferase
MTILRLDTRIRRLIAAILSGAMISIATALHPWWPIAWIAVIPLLAAAFVASPLEAVGLAVLAAVVGCISTTGFYLEVAGPTVAFLAPMGRAVELVVAVTLARRAVVQWRHWLSIFVYPALTAGFDMLESSFSAHGAAASFAQSQMNAIAVIQIAALAGTSGVVFTVNLFASTLAVAWYQRSGWNQFRRGYLLAGLLVFGVLAFGFIRVATARSEPGVLIGLVVVDTPVKVQAGSIDTALWSTYKSAIDDAARRGARIVVLPEKIAPLSPAEASPLRRALAAVAKSDQVYLLVGVTIAAPDRRENRAWLLDPSGATEADYSKRHLVPRFEDAFVPGRVKMIRIVQGTLSGIAICKDMDFPRLGREYSRQDVRLMLVPAWDFGRDNWQHSRVAILRGVEDGYTIARAAKDGFLTLSDSYGRVLYQAPSSNRPYASLVAKVPVGTGETPYALVGNTFGWLALILGVALGVVAPTMAARRKKQAEDDKEEY